MANLIKQKFLEGIDSSKFKIEQGGAIKAVNSTGQLVDVFKFDTVNEVVKVYGDEEVAVNSYVDALISQEVQDRNTAIDQAISDLINGAPQALDTLKELADKLADEESAINALISQLATETANRESGDNALDARLDIVEGDENTTGSIAKSLKDAKAYTDVETSRAQAAEADLQDQIDDLSGGGESLRGDLDQEILDRQAGDDALDARLDVVEGDENTVGSIAKALKDAKDYTDSEVSSEESRAMMVESGLDSRLTTAESDIDSLEGRMTQAESDINSEESRAMMVESGLDSRLTTAESDIDSLEGRMTQAESDINSEESRAMMAESALDGRLDIVEGDENTVGSIAKALKDAKDYTDSEVSSEESRAMMAESGLDSRLDIVEGDENTVGSIAKALKDAKDYTDSEVSSEESRAMMAESGLDSRLDILEGSDSTVGSVAKALKDAKDYTDAEVSSEESRAMGVESGLQTQIDTEKGRIDAILLASDADKDSFAEIVQLINSVDTTNDQAFASYVLSNDAALAQEVSDRQQGDSDLQDAIDQEILDRQSAVSAEQTRAMGVESDLQDAIDQEILDRQSAVSSEETRAMGVEAGLQSAIDQEILDRSAEDLTFFKHDGSRQMTGSLDMNGNDIQNSGDVLMSPDKIVKWEIVDGAETRLVTHSQYQSSNQVYDQYSNSHIRMSLGEGFRKTYSQQEILDQDGNVMVGATTENIQINGTSVQMSYTNPELSEAGTYGTSYMQMDTYNNNTAVGYTLTLEPANGLNLFKDGVETIKFNHDEFTLRKENSDKFKISHNEFGGATMEFLGSVNRISSNLLQFYNSNIDFVASNVSFYSDESATPFYAQYDHQVVTKGFLDSNLSPILAKAAYKESFVIDSASELNYVDLTKTVDSGSLMVFVNRLALHEGIDYTVSVVSLYDGDVTRITWIGDFEQGEVEGIESGDVINVSYRA